MFDSPHVPCTVGVVKCWGIWRPPVWTWTREPLSLLSSTTAERSLPRYCNIPGEVKFNKINTVFLRTENYVDHESWLYKWFVRSQKGWTVRPRKLVLLKYLKVNVFWSLLDVLLVYHTLSTLCLLGLTARVRQRLNRVRYCHWLDTALLLGLRLDVLYLLSVSHITL